MRGAGSYSGDRQSGKSELTVCNFVEDLNVFMTAKSDAIEILNNPTEASNAKYLASIEIEKDLHIV
jgi:RecG-like helicase